MEETGFRHCVDEEKLERVSKGGLPVPVFKAKQGGGDKSAVAVSYIYGGAKTARHKAITVDHSVVSDLSVRR